MTGESTSVANVVLRESAGLQLRVRSFGLRVFGIVLFPTYTIQSAPLLKNKKMKLSLILLFSLYLS